MVGRVTLPETQTGNDTGPLDYNLVRKIVSWRFHLVVLVLVVLPVLPRLQNKSDSELDIVGLARSKEYGEGEEEEEELPRRSILLGKYRIPIEQYEYCDCDYYYRGEFEGDEKTNQTKLHGRTMTLRRAVLVLQGRNWTCGDN